MNYILNVEVAVKYGVDEAIMLENIVFWIRKNQANNKHFYDGEYWTYNSVKAFSELFPFWSERQIDRILKSLEKQNAIIVGNYNKRGYDRTKWYAITSTVKSIYRIGEYSISLNGKMSDNANSPNGEMEFTKWGNGIHQTVKPIPDINTDINTDINLVESTNVDSKDFPSEKSSPAPYDKIRDLYNSICKSYPKCTRLSAGRKKAIHARIKSGYTVEDFEKVFQLAEQSRFLKGGNDRNWHADFDWLIKDANMAKVLDGKYQDKQGGQNSYGCAAGAGASKGPAESKKAYGGILILPSGEIIDETGGSEPVGKDPLYDPDEDW